MNPQRRSWSSWLGVLACASAWACGDDAGTIEGGPPEVECPSDSEDVPTFDQVDAISQVCTDCHDSSLSGAQRRNAPSSLNFDDYDVAHVYAERMATEVYWGNMPPSGSDLTLTAEQIDELLLWAMCGAPE
jgi:mono/diheme cytochrome c family protein